MMSLDSSEQGSEETIMDTPIGESLTDDAERCAHALDNVHAFLRGELDESLADDIREHLLACENCLDNFHVEELITKLIQRCNANPECCSETLRARVSALHVVLA
jgi:anti-sigma factor (TIGR02949 family)